MDLTGAALIVVDFQEDFCPPKGALAVEGGRDIALLINKLLRLPWTLRIATLDWHPRDHVSFASVHSGLSMKIGSSLEVPNPMNPGETRMIRLWPDHCVQGSPGADLVPELDMALIDHQVKKGEDQRIEMFSAFRDSYTSPSVYQSSLSRLLEDAKVSRVYVVGLAADYCVKETALHAAKDGFEATVIADATRAVDQSDQAMQELRELFAAQDVKWLGAKEALRNL